MATTTTKPNDPVHPERRLRDPYLLHRLHSLSGILPIGLFLVQHLIANSYALRGEAAYNTVVKVFGYLPFVVVLEIAVIYLPILYHSIYGFYIAAIAQPNLGTYGYGRNWLYLMQRISGVIAFFYIGFHIWQTSLAKYQLQWQGDPNPERAINYATMAHHMTNPLYFAIYLIGIAGTVFHFTNGLWNFCVRWGLTISARSQRLNAYFCWGLFAVLTLIGWATANTLRVHGS